MAKFQMVGSTNPRTIADVSAPVDINSFRHDHNWYEIIEEEASVKAIPRKRKVKGDNDGNKEEKV